MVNWPFNLNTRQANLNMSNLTLIVFFIDHKMVFFINQIGQKIGQPKK